MGGCHVLISKLPSYHLSKDLDTSRTQNPNKALEIGGRKLSNLRLIQDVHIITTLSCNHVKGCH
jgi:hypothetical protein